MAYLFTPPTNTRWQRIVGSLGYNMDVSTTVFKNAAGTWVAVETPSQDDLYAALEVISTSGRPRIIPDDMAAELIAAGIGTCEVLQL